MHRRAKLLFSLSLHHLLVLLEEESEVSRRIRKTNIERCSIQPLISLL